MSKQTDVSIDQQDLAASEILKAACLVVFGRNCIIEALNATLLTLRDIVHASLPEWITVARCVFYLCLEKQKYIYRPIKTSGMSHYLH